MALIQPGFALAPKATKQYDGIEYGQLHIDKVLHACDRDMCIGEVASRNVIRTSVSVVSMGEVALETADELFSSFKAVIADTLTTRVADITLGAQTDTGNLRRWLQESVSGIFSFTIEVNTDRLASLLQRITQWQLADGEDDSFMLDGNTTIHMSTLSDPVVVETSVMGVQCRVGHDPKSPLCHVCLDGFMEGMDKICTECEGSSDEWVRIVALIAAIILGCLLIILVYFSYQKYAARSARNAAVQMHCKSPV